jgi:SRSO17 transposase
MQHLLGRAKWDADQVRDDVSDYVVEHLHDDEAVLVVETGDVKKGTPSVSSASTPAPHAGSRTPRSPST